MDETAAKYRLSEIRNMLTHIREYPIWSDSDITQLDAIDHALHNLRHSMEVTNER